MTQFGNILNNFAKSSMELCGVHPPTQIQFLVRLVFALENLKLLVYLKPKKNDRLLVKSESRPKLFSNPAHKARPCLQFWADRPRKNWRIWRKHRLCHGLWRHGTIIIDC